MCKKVFISFLLVALINFLVGCYSSELVTVGEYNQIEEEDKPDDIRVITKYSEYYMSDFYIENDTLYGKGKEILYDKEKPFDGKIALSNIESIEVESYNSQSTIFLIIGIGAILILTAVFIAYAYAMSRM